MSMDTDKLNQIELQLKAINSKLTFFVVVVVLWILLMVGWTVSFYVMADQHAAFTTNIPNINYIYDE